MFLGVVKRKTPKNMGQKSGVAHKAANICYLVLLEKKLANP